MTLYVVAGCAVVAALGLGVAFLLGAYRRFYVCVRPDEYVVHYGRGGRVKHCGRGVSFFCWPGETYLAVPSTLRDVNFVADQITTEKQGVRVQGFLAYRISDFEKAYQTLDLRARASRVLMAAEKNVDNNEYATKTAETLVKFDPNDSLAKTDLVLRRLAESVVRHEVSNKTVQQMIEEREAVIDSMKDQIAPTVARWGLVVETIEFTEVWVRSKTLFEHLQAEYRNKVRFEAEKSTSETERAIAENRLESEREIARLAAEAERFRRVVASKESLAAREEEIRTAELEKQRELEMDKLLAEQRIENQTKLQLLEREKAFEQMAREQELRQANELQAKAHELARLQEEHKLTMDERAKQEEVQRKEAETVRAMMELAKRREIEEAELERQRAEVALQQALEAERQVQEVRRLEAETEAGRIIRLAQANREKVLREAEAQERAGEAAALSQKLMTEARNVVNANQLQALLIGQLASMAGNMKVDEVHWVNMNGEGKSPLGIIPENIMQLLGVCKGMGVDLGSLIPGAKGSTETPAK